jgi:hypothetical protein
MSIRKNIGYHTRSRVDNSIKFTGGSFGGAFDQETIERLVNAHFTVKVKSNGHAVFIDREGRECWLYVTVDPDSTAKGKAALAEYRKTVEQQQRIEREKEDRLEILMQSMTTDELLKLLENKGD